MSNSDQVADLLVPGDQYLTELINRNNKTSWDVTDLVIGAPQASADESYNTDIEVSFSQEPTAEEPDPDPIVGELHYSRFDLGRLFSSRSIKLRDNDYQTIRELIVPLAEEVRIAFEVDDFIDGPIPSGSPKRVVIQADPNSLRFVGRFSLDIVEPIVPDTSFIVNPPVVTPNIMPSRMAMKHDDTLVFGENNLSGAMIVAGNDEIEVAGAARLSTYHGVFQSTDETYHLNIADKADWTLPYSFALLSTRNGDRLTDLYTCTVRITAQQGGGYLNFELRRQYGKLVLVDEDNQLNIHDPSCYNDEQTLFQNIIKLTTYKSKLGSLTVNAQGAPYGVFTVELKAVRKSGSVDPVVVTYTVNVEGLEP